MRSVPLPNVVASLRDQGIEPLGEGFVEGNGKAFHGRILGMNRLTGQTLAAKPSPFPRRPCQALQMVRGVFHFTPNPSFGFRAEPLKLF